MSDQPQFLKKDHATLVRDLLRDLADPAGRPLALALELLFHARRTYTADPKNTFEGLLACLLYTSPSPRD